MTAIRDGVRPVGPVVEVRVHGVHGGHPADALGDPFPRQVAGDDDARFWRRRGPQDSSHLLEAFDWGRFTSGSPTRALWLLLVPFGLVNLATYTILPTKSTRFPRSVVGAVRGTLRLLGLGLTLGLLLAVAQAGLDVVMHQCATASACVHDNTWLSPAENIGDGPRLLLGSAPLAVFVALLWWFGRQSFLHKMRGDAKTVWSDTDFGDSAFWNSGNWVHPLRAGHVIASCATLGLVSQTYVLADRADHTTAPAVAVPGVLCKLLVLVAVAAVMAPKWFVNEEKWRSGWFLKQGERLALVIAVVSVGCSAAVTADARTVVASPARELPGFENAATTLAEGIVVLLVFLFLVCGVLIKCYDRPPNLPGPFKPLWFGFGPFVLATVGTALAGGFSSGIVFWVANLLGRIGTPAHDTGQPAEYPITLGASYTSVATESSLLVLGLLAFLPAVVAALLRTRAYPVLAVAGVITLTAVIPMPWSATARPALLVVAAVSAVVGLVLCLFGWRSMRLRTLAADDYPPSRNDGQDLSTDSITAKKIANQWRLARSRYRYHWPLGLVAALFTAAVGLQLSFPRVGDALPVNVGPLVLSGVAAAFVTLGLRSWSNVGLRTTVGILWDLLAFWPRAAHPLCPPPYGGRAVLELAQRAVDLHAEPDSAACVVLSGHSQGSLICAAAVEVLATEARDRHRSDSGFLKPHEAAATLETVAMVTYGSQLQWAYARLFPRYIGYARIKNLYEVRLGGRWRNLHRWTDPLGGPVLAWVTGRVPQPPPQRCESFPAPSPASGSSAPIGDRTGADIRLLDPVSIVRRPDTVRSPLRGHSDYYLDPAYDDAVTEVARVLVATFEPEPARR